MNLEEINTDAWQFSAATPGEIVTELEDIGQCIMMIIGTQKGSDPVNPLFGVDLMSWIDRPTTVMIPNLIKEITTQVGIWEPRAIVEKVTYAQEAGAVTFTLEWTTNTGIPGITNYTYKV